MCWVQGSCYVQVNILTTLGELSEPQREGFSLREDSTCAFEREQLRNQNQNVDVNIRVVRIKFYSIGFMNYFVNQILEFRGTDWPTKSKRYRFHSALHLLRRERGHLLYEIVGLNPPVEQETFAIEDSHVRAQ